MSGRSELLFGFIAVLCFVRVWFLRSKSYAKIAGLCWFLHDFFFFFFSKLLERPTKKPAHFLSIPAATACSSGLAPAPL